MDEEEVWIILHSEPRKTDLDLLFDLSMEGRRRGVQLLRWREDPSFFVYRDVTAMLKEDLAARRRKEVMKKIIKDFKEGTRGQEEN